MLRIGSLFSGIGGLELGLEWSGLGPVIWQAENNAYCLQVLEKHWPNVKRYQDVKEVTGSVEKPDLICGGFPCRDISSAGKGKGLSGSRSGLWAEFYRIVHEIEPEWVVVENVAGAASRWVDSIRGSLELIGYETLPIPLSAQSVGAPHLRRRVFIVARACDTWAQRRWRSGGAYTVANPRSSRRRKDARRSHEDESEHVGRTSKNNNEPDSDGKGYPARQVPGIMADSDSKQEIGPAEPWDERNPWAVESKFRRVDNEFSQRLDQIALEGGQYAYATETGSKKALCVLWQNNATQKDQWPVRGPSGLFTQSILQPLMYGAGFYQRGCESCGPKEASRSVSREGLRGLRHSKPVEYPSQGQQPGEQRCGESDNVMRFLSHEMALETWQSSLESAGCLQDLRGSLEEIGYVFETLSEIQEVWRSLSDEEKDWICLRLSAGDPWCAEWPNAPRTSHGIPQRVDRLKALGNAVVPQCAEVIGYVIQELRKG